MEQSRLVVKILFIQAEEDNSFFFLYVLSFVRGRLLIAPLCLFALFWFS